MAGRDPHEEGRASTPLELLFDLTFVVAVGVSADLLAEGVSAGHAGAAVVAFSFCAFAVFWAWLNFSWFASAFDTDDWLFRLLTMGQMVGVCILALGVEPVFRSVEAGERIDNTVLVLGYVVMRLFMVAQWLRVARQSPTHRALALTYVKAVIVAQAVWVVIALLPLGLRATLPLVLVAYAVELAGPVMAERRGGGSPWHPHHIAERYGLFAIIALGEGVVGTVAALTSLQAVSGLGVDLLLVGVAGVGLTFGMWWVYFTVPAGEVLHRHRERGFVWGYAHVVVLGAVVATGAGIHVAALSLTSAPTGAAEGDVAGHAAVIGDVGVVLSVAVPVGVYLVSLVAVHRYLVRAEQDPLHLVLTAVTLVVLGLAVALAAMGAGVTVCLLVVTLAPVVLVAGHETVGHEHVSRALERA